MSAVALQVIFLPGRNQFRTRNEHKYSVQCNSHQSWILKGCFIFNYFASAHSFCTYLRFYSLSISIKNCSKKSTSPPTRERLNYLRVLSFVYDGLIMEISQLSAQKKKLHFQEGNANEIRRQISCGSQIWHCEYSLKDEASQPSA